MRNGWLDGWLIRFGATLVHGQISSTRAKCTWRALIIHGNLDEVLESFLGCVASAVIPLIWLYFYLSYFSCDYYTFKVLMWLWNAPAWFRQVCFWAMSSGLRSLGLFWMLFMLLYPTNKCFLIFVLLKVLLLDLHIVSATVARKNQRK